MPDRGGRAYELEPPPPEMPSFMKRSAAPQRKSSVCLQLYGIGHMVKGHREGRGMCYPVCGMMLIKEPLLLIGKSSLCGGSGFSLSLSEWSFTICPTSYNRK